MNLHKVVLTLLCLLPLTAQASTFEPKQGEVVIEGKRISLTRSQAAQLALSTANSLSNIIEPETSLSTYMTGTEAVLAFTQDKYGPLNYLGIILTSAALGLIAEATLPWLENVRFKNPDRAMRRYLAITLSLFRMKNTLLEISQNQEATE